MKLLLIPPRIQRVSQAIADQVEANHRDHDQDARREDKVYAANEIAARIGQHIAPGGRRRLDADAEITQARFDQ